MNKVLVIARVFPPLSSVGHSIRVVKFAKYLPTHGWLPVILTIDDQNEYETMRRMGSEAMLSEIPREVRIYRTNAGEPSLEFLMKEKEFSQRNWLSALVMTVFSAGRRWLMRTIMLPDRSLGWLPFAVDRARQINKNEGIDAIFATCPPHSAALIGSVLKILLKKPLVLDFRDDWIGTPWYHSRPRITQFIERQMEKWAVKKADKVVLVTEWSRTAFRIRYPGEPSTKFVLIPNGCDLADVPPDASLSESIGGSKFTIVHAGSLNDSKSWTRSPEGLFQALHRIINRHPDLSGKLTLVIAGNLPRGHKAIAEDLALSDVVDELGQLPHDQVMRLIRSADLLLAINYEDFATLIPGKIYEYWAAGSSAVLLLSCDGAAQELVDQKGLGITVPPDDVSAIEDAVMNAYRRREVGDPMQVNLEGIEQYDRKNLSNILAQTLSGIVP